MTQLYMGSEGTLGIITELTLRLHTVPAVRCGAFVSFPDIARAATCTVRMLRAQLATRVRCECLNADAIRATGRHRGRKGAEERLPKWGGGNPRSSARWLYYVRQLEDQHMSQTQPGETPMTPVVPGSEPAGEAA